MKIIQLNIWGGKLGQQIIDFLNTEKPDFVCLQEVNDLEGRSGTKRFATLDEIKEECGFKAAFMSPAYSFRYMERELHYGNAILSKLPFTSTKTIFTRGEHKPNFDVVEDDGNIRNLQIATVEIQGKSFNILNHHGHHVPKNKDGNDETTRQMKIIATQIDLISAPVILCGDFNLSPDSPSLAHINARLTNLSLKHKLKNTYSQLHSNQVVCDYIFVNDLVKAKNFMESDTLVSDHKALVLEFDL